MKISIYSFACSAILIFQASFIYGAEDVAKSAIVLMTSGTVTVRPLQTEQEHPAKMFQKLGAGDQIKTAADGNTTIAFLSGKRFQILPASEVQVTNDAFKVLAGAAKPLPEIPNSVRLAPILLGSGTDETGATVRLRNVVADEYIESLYPRDGAGIYATSATLRFQPLAGTNKYAVAIETTSGEIVYQTQTEKGEIPVPDGVLQHGNQYRWTVETSEGAEIFAWGVGSFQVLPKDQEKMRNDLRDYAMSTKDTTAWTLLVGLDMKLGLWWEGREDLKIAQDFAGQNAELSALGSEIDKRTHLLR